MSSFKIILCAGALLGLVACGFSPMYGEQGAGKPAVSASLNDIEISNIADREGQYLRNALIDRLHTSGSPQAPRYMLAVSRLNKRVVGLGVRKDATTTRGQIDIDAKIRLIDRLNNKTLLERDLNATAGYNRLNNLYATMVSEENSTNLALDELSEAITTELALYFARAGDQPAQPLQAIQPPAGALLP